MTNAREPAKKRGPKARKPTIPFSDFEARASAVLGGRGWKSRWCEALDYMPSHMSRVAGGKSHLPVPWVAILEMLETLPQGQWPLRWQR